MNAGDDTMIDSILNLLFRCSHRRLTRPMTPVLKTGGRHGDTYIVCLDCGKQFEYDLKTMQMGKAIDHSHAAGVLPPNMPKPRKTKVKYALLAAVPLAVVVGAALTGKKKSSTPEAPNPAPVEPEQATPRSTP
jgi:hypothetical protein